MNDRERFLNCMSFKPVDRLPRWELGVRPDTAERWHNEGLPANVPGTVGWTEYFGFDRGGGYAGSDLTEGTKMEFRPLPSLKGKVLQEDETTLIRTSTWGGTVRVPKKGESIPQYLSFAVKTREDFHRFKKMLNADDPARYPANWELLKDSWRSRTCPLSMYTYGWYGVLRELMGVEELSVAFHEEEALIDEMCEFWGDYVIRLFDRALRETNPDYMLFWEDLAYKTGPLLSPRHFKRYFSPHYRRVIDHFRRHGVRLFEVDSDGQISDIIPLWLEAGVNFMMPFEVAAGMDVNEVRRRFGRSLGIVGGIDKQEIAKGPEAIEREVRRMLPLMEDGGYIPTLDHSPIPEISLADFKRYRALVDTLGAKHHPA